MGPGADGGIELSVVVPVYNLAGSIVRNVEVIRDRVSAGIDGPVEVIVVSDGSIDRTDEVVLESDPEGVRLLHYDRNLGKGYAVKLGALEARGRWIAYCDADLDLDPGSLPAYVAEAERDGLDFAIGSKRHPQSRVHYPGSRRAASWCFQQLVRVLFRLDVRDTQVGLKVFRRDVAEQVVPFLLVKRYAFDIELLAVGRAFGFSRVRELPVTLDYQFAGSGVRPATIAAALVDTLAIFYRLRILRTYQRKRAFAGAYGWTRPSGFRPRVTVVGSDEAVVSRLDWPELDFAVAADAAERRQAAEDARSPLIAFVAPGASPSGNFLDATVPFLARDEVSAVVVSNLAPREGSLRSRAAALVNESRFGGGSHYFRFLPGNIRYIRDFPVASYVVRRESFLALPADVDPLMVPSALAERGLRTLYTPEAFVVVPPPPLVVPHLRGVATYGRLLGAAVARRGLAALRPTTGAAVAAAAFGASGWLLFLAGPDWLDVWLGFVAAYVVLVLAKSLLTLVQTRSAAVALAVAGGIVLTHATYAGSFLAGVLRPRGKSLESS